MLRTVQACKGARHVSNGGAIIPYCPYKRPATAVKGVHLPSRLGGLGSFVNSLAGSGAEPQPSRNSQTILGRFLFNFMRFHASFSAFSSYLEMRDSYIPL